MELTKEQKLRELEAYLQQLARKKFEDQCQTLINVPAEIDGKIAVLEKLKKEIEGS